MQNIFVYGLQLFMPSIKADILKRSDDKKPSVSWQVRYIGVKILRNIVWSNLVAFFLFFSTFHLLGFMRMNSADRMVGGQYAAMSCSGLVWIISCHMKDVVWTLWSQLKMGKYEAEFELFFKQQHEDWKKHLISDEINLNDISFKMNKKFTFYISRLSDYLPLFLKSDCFGNWTNLHL